MQYVLVNKMSLVLKSVITCAIVIACICMHGSESTVEKGVLPLNSDTFDKARMAQTLHSVVANEPSTQPVFVFVILIKMSKKRLF